MRVVLAPDKFKGSLTGAEVAQALADGLTAERADLEIVQLPVADGGEGTVASALAAGFGEVGVNTFGPTGLPRRASYALAGSRAVVELAGVCGLDLLPRHQPDPLHASTYGLGIVLADAIGHGAREIVLGVGGSASTDGGAGMAQAMGAHLYDSWGQEIGRGGAALADLRTLDLTALDRLVEGVSITVATDVTNPLLGPTGAAPIFGPQKGANSRDIALLERGLENLAEVVARAKGRDYSAVPGAGAACGTGFAAIALLGGTVHSGIDVVLKLLDFDASLQGADLVITGEGSLDEQSLAGKAPYGVAQAATRAGVQVVAVAGRNLLSQAQLAEVGIAVVYPLSALEPDIDKSISEAPALLRRLGAWIATEWTR